jgi:hypothetical protein
MMIRHVSLFIAFFTLVAFIAPGSAVNSGVNTIALGGEVFIGEEGLDISDCIGNATQLAWFASGTSPSSNVPDYVLAVGDPADFYVSPEIFADRAGLWYQWLGLSPAGPPAVNVLDPYMEMAILSQSTMNVASFGIIPRGDYLNFWASTNLWAVSSRPGYNASTDGPFTFRVKSPDGVIYSALYQDAGTAIPLTGISFSSADATWVPLSPDLGWNTGVTDPSGTAIYKNGLYEVILETDLNGIKDNYRDQDGAEYIGKTVTYAHPVSIVSDAITLTASTTALTRGNQFIVSIAGMPSAAYLIWVENTGQMTGLPGDQPPFLLPSQSGLKRDPTGGPYTYGGYQYQGGAGQTVQEDVPAYPDNGTVYYGLVTLKDTGTRTIAWQTTAETRDRVYSIRVERGPPGSDGLPPAFSDATEYRTSRVEIQVAKGTVTIASSGGKGPVPEQVGLLPDSGSAAGTVSPTTLPEATLPATPVGTPDLLSEATSSATPVMTESSFTTPTQAVSPLPTRAPGFSGMIALAGLGAVVFFSARRR